VTHCSQKLNAAVAVVVETAYARFDSAVVVDVATLLGPANSHYAVETYLDVRSTSPGQEADDALA